MLFFDICKYFLENINNEQKGAMQKANVLPPYKPADSVQEGEKQESGLAAAPFEKMNWLELPRIVGFDTRVEFASSRTCSTAGAYDRQRINLRYTNFRLIIDFLCHSFVLHFNHLTT